MPQASSVRIPFCAVAEGGRETFWLEAAQFAREEMACEEPLLPYKLVVLSRFPKKVPIIWAVPPRVAGGLAGLERREREVEVEEGGEVRERVGEVRSPSRLSDGGKGFRFRLFPLPLSSELRPEAPAC